MPEPLPGKEAVGEYFQSWMTAFPDFQANVTNRVMGEDSIPSILGVTEAPRRDTI